MCIQDGYPTASAGPMEKVRPWETERIKTLAATELFAKLQAAREDI